MEKWYYICLLLCAVGVFKEFRPSEPFVTKYLVQYKNFTKETIVQVAYPIATYTHLATLPIIFLITDFLRYKLIVILEGFAFVACYILLIWGEGLTNLKVLEILYGIAGSAEIAYYTYIYNKVDKVDYKKVTSYIHSAIIVGNLIAAIISQVFVTFGVMNIRELNYLTLGSTTIALFLSLFLPSVKQSMYFQQLSIESQNSNNNGIETRTTAQTIFHFPKFGPRSLISKLKYSCPLLWKHFMFAYSNNHVLKWSIWWAIATAGYFQIVNYVQALWLEINEGSKTPLYNGATDAIHRSLSTIIAISVGHAKIRWNKWGEVLLTVFSLVQGIVLIVMSQTTNLFTAYGTYIFYRVSFQVMITIASAEVAEKISDDSYGLIFGINGFMATLLQTILTFTVTDESGLALNVRQQFVVYGGYHFTLGICFAGTVLHSIFRSQCGSRRTANSREVVCANDNDMPHVNISTEVEPLNVASEIPI